MTFGEFCKRHSMTPEEKREAAIFLAFLRARRTLEALWVEITAEDGSPRV